LDLLKVKRQAIAVGWSGGVDSTALLLALKQGGYNVHAWHIDHAWHDDSAICCDQLAAQAKEWGIPFFHQRLPSPQQNNREGLAREGRYQAFSYLGKQHNTTTLCLAHHADDQAETVCMRLLQGASFKGCRGMHDERWISGLHILRPLLHISKNRLSAALIQAGVTTIEDPSNDDLSLWRNRIRHRLFPAMTTAGYAPTLLFLRWQKQATLLNHQVMQLADTIIIDKKTQHCQVPWLAWQACVQPVRVEILQRMMAHTCGAGRVLGRRHIQLIDTWLQQGGHHGLDLTGCRLSHQKSILVLSV